MNYFHLLQSICFILIIEISFLAAETTDFYSESWALVIGINNYQHERQLHYAVADAQDLSRLLSEKLDFPEQNIILLLDDAATLQGIKQSMQELANKTSKNDRVLIYFGGHGKTQPLPSGGEEGYLIPVNGKSSDLFSTSLAMSEMNRLSNMTPAKDMLFLMDACYSGLMGVGGRTLDLDENSSDFLKKIASGGSRTVITAGKKGEIAQERPVWGHSPFVKNIISGLEKGMANANGDQYITDRELGEYLIYQVTLDTDNKQTPTVSHFTSDQGQFVFIINDINLSLDYSEDNTTANIDYDKIAELTAEKMALKMADKSGSSQNELVTPTDSMFVVEKYFSSGKKKYAHNYNSNMKKHGKQYGFYSSGKKKYEYNFHNGTKRSKQIEYYSSGKKKHEYNYNIGTLHGEQITYYTSGKKKSTTLYNNGEFISGSEIDYEIFEMYDEDHNENLKDGKEDIEGVNEDIAEAREDVEEAVNDILKELKDLGVKIQSEEIAKNIADNIPFIEDEENILIDNSTFSKSPIWHFENNEASPFWMRYNRSEGLYLQLNDTFQSDIMPGSSFYGGLGRAFHRNEYQWILGYEQLIMKNTLQYYLEVFDKSITPDAWRVWDGENSLAAIFFKKDYLDWYRGQGFRSAGFIHINNYISIGIEYNQVDQSSMNNVLNGEKFNNHNAFKIQEGNNNYLNSIMTFGYPIDIGVRNKFQFYSSIVRSQSTGDSEILYAYDNLFLHLLVPYTSDLNFNIKILAGASDIALSIWKDGGYHQHIFEIGGKGTLRGYAWKEFSSSHYFLSTMEIWFDEFGILYDRAIMFESPGNTFNPNYFSDLGSNFSTNVHQSAGISIGDEDASLSFIRQLSGDNATNIYLTLTFSSPLQYW